MKKIMAVVLILSLCMFNILFGACDSFLGLFSCKKEEEHSHSYGPWEIIEDAKCTKSGLKSKKCVCGDIITEITPATGHNYVNGICTDCGDILND